MSGKDIRVEMLRIIGAIIVVAVHLCLPMMDGGSLDRTRALIAVFFADGVAIFWFISGFFMYEKYDFKHTLKRTLKNVVIPLVAFCVFLFLFGEQQLGIKDVLRSIMLWENPFNEHVQLWYLYVYILLMLVSPVVYAFITYIKENPKRENYFLFISFVFFVINDISNNRLAAFSHHTINALVPAMILTVWGNIIYRRIKEAKLNSKHIWIAGGVFGFCNVFRWGIQILRTLYGVEGIHIYFWFTSLAVINVSCIIFIIFALLKNKRCNKKLTKFIKKVSSYTFMIYLLHMLVYRVLQKFIDFDNAYNWLCDILPNGEGFFSEVLYVIIIVPTVFVLTLGLAIVLRKVKKLLWNKR